MARLDILTAEVIPNGKGAFTVLATLGADRVATHAPIDGIALSRARAKNIAAAATKLRSIDTRFWTVREIAR